LCADLYHECTTHLEQARDACPPDDVTGRLYAVCREFRRWSIAHPAEFGLMFGSPLPGLGNDQHDRDQNNGDSDKHAAAMRFAAVFGGLFAQLWVRSPFPVLDADEIDPQLGRQLEAYLHEIGAPLPVGAIQQFLSCWIRLYGMVAMEVFGHLRFALSDPEPMFEAELTVMARQLGMTDAAPTP